MSQIVGFTVLPNDGRPGTGLDLEKSIGKRNGRRNTTRATTTTPEKREKATNNSEQS